MPTANDSKTPTRRGRPPVDSEMVRSRLERRLLDRLDAYVVATPGVDSRSEAVRVILAAWLGEHSYGAGGGMVAAGLADKPAEMIEPAAMASAADAEPASDGLSDEDRMAMWEAEDQWTEDACRQLKRMGQWQRDMLLQALASANIDDVLHRFDWQRAIPYNRSAPPR